MKRILRLLITLPLLLLLAVFALSNREPARFSFWPTDLSVELPLSLAILGSAAIAFLFGGLLVWLTTLAQSRRARRAEEAVQLLEEQVRAWKSRLAPPLSGHQALPPPTA